MTQKSTLKAAACAFFLYICAPYMIHAQNAAGENTGYVKKGWSFSPLPALSYSSDLGFQLGGYFEVYYFGDGSKYPEYLHKIVAEAAYFTKGSGIYHLFYDSKYLLPGLRLTVSASYIPSTMAYFYGFNGYASPYLPGEKEKNGAFYNIKRNIFRTMTDVQGRISGNFGWAAGMAFYNYNTGRVVSDKYSGRKSLYDTYLKESIIKSNEGHGGSHIEFRAGIVYDSRDNEPDPTRGIYSNAILYGSPDIIKRRGYDYMKLAATFSHYVPLIGKRLTFAYRLSYQGTLAGSVPFYVQQNYTMLYLRRISADILGGGFSLRGILQNRVVSDGMVWGNVELRYRLPHFKLLKQDWYIVINPFFDAGISVQPYRLAEMKAVTSDNSSLIYSGQRENLHMSAGIGGKLIMNSNFVLGAEYGRAFDRRDGKGGLYLDLNYIF